MTPKYIILHHSLTKDSGTVSWNAIRKYHKKIGCDDIGYQYGIELIKTYYEILVGRMLNETGAHCRQDRMNHKSVGICFIGNYDITPVPPEMFQVGVRLVASLCDVLSISTDRIYPHSLLADKTCPGKMFDVDGFIEAVERKREKH